MADGCAGPRHQRLLAHARECSGVGRTHLVPGQDGEHGGCRSATTNAMATSVVCVRERWNCRAPRAAASVAAAPCRTTDGAFRVGPSADGTPHFDVGERETTEAGSERLHHGLLRREACGQGLTRIGGAAGVRLFGVGEEAGGKPGTACQHPSEPGHVDRIHADADDGTAFGGGVTVGGRAHAPGDVCAGRVQRGGVQRGGVERGGRSFDGHRPGWLLEGVASGSPVTPKMPHISAQVTWGFGRDR